MNEVTAFVALAAGLVSFLSPCVFPLIPSYLSFIGGVGFAGSVSQRKIVLHTLFFVLGFSIVFTLLGIGMSVGGSLISRYASVYELIAGMLILLLGLNLLFGFIPMLYREARVHARRSPGGPLGALAVGAAFGAGWTPCIGPMLATILLIAGAEGGVAAGAGYLLLYSLGLGIPFLAAGVFFGRFTRLQQRLRRYTGRIQTLSGIILSGLGLLIATGRFQLFTAYLLGGGERLQRWAAASPRAASLVSGIVILLLALLPVGVRIARRQRPGKFAVGVAAAGLLLAVLEFAGPVNLALLVGEYLQFQGL